MKRLASMLAFLFALSATASRAEQPKEDKKPKKPDKKEAKASGPADGDLSRAINNQVLDAVATEMERSMANLRIESADGATLHAEVPVAKGHPGNPMNWDDMWAKFSGLTENRLGARAQGLFAAVRGFGNGEALALIRAAGVN